MVLLRGFTEKLCAPRFLLPETPGDNGFDQSFAIAKVVLQRRWVFLASPSYDRAQGYLVNTLRQK
jgi:hypothetical protein